jgi:hypothetical protein
LAFRILLMAAPKLQPVRRDHARPQLWRAPGWPVSLAIALAVSWALS